MSRREGSRGGLVSGRGRAQRWTGGWEGKGSEEDW